MQQLLAGEVKAVEVRAQSSGIAIRTDVDSSCDGRYFSDTLRLHHILCALLSNALKVSKTGSICVSANSRPSMLGAYPIVSSAVSDTGVGIPGSRQAALFESSLDSPTTNRNGDNDRSGLGLATVKAALASLHGTIHLESSIGKGSTFTIELPLRTI